jgi:hypothetical protein
MQQMIDYIAEMIEMHLMQETMYARRLVHLVMIGVNDQQHARSSDQTGNGANRKGQWEVAHIAKHATKKRSCNTTDAIR